MTLGKNVLLVGWSPIVSNYRKWPGLNPEKLTKLLDEAIKSLTAKGYNAEWCLVLNEKTAKESVKKSLKNMQYNCVMIGAGVRLDEDAFFVFESLINVIHEYAPQAKICFNTNPNDTVEAIQRWLP